MIGHVGVGYYAQEPIIIKAKNGINQIRANHLIHATITANANGGSGNVGVIETISATSDGHFLGTITANGLTGLPNKDPITLAGDLRGDISIVGDLTREITILRDFQVTRTISIGGSLGSGGGFNIGSDSNLAQCLVGQIIINANNVGGTWSASAPAVLGPSGVALSPIPSYTNLPSSFGGGAIGEAPFNFHAAACNPAHNSSTSVASFPDPVILRHYGPVCTTGTQPVRVYARATARQRGPTTPMTTPTL